MLKVVGMFWAVLMSSFSHSGFTNVAALRRDAADEGVATRLEVR